uniref:Arylphorin n=1 Tax=Cacopsylla melanoneura TaxID=428564 RepID=A0A8D8QK47_9HEMI
MPEESYNSPQSMDEVKSDLSHNFNQEHAELIPTRSTKIPTSKPPTNPLQFVKVGPAALYKTANDQIKKVEVVKKVKEEVKETTDWQSNLDNWKCSRRKRQEHIIERVVEVKKLESTDLDKQGRKNKTFSEMMEERTSKGRKPVGIPTYEDDSNDLSDLGLSTSTSSNNNDSEMNNSENTEDIPPDKTALEDEPATKPSDSVDSVPDTKVSCTEPKPKTKSIQPSKSQPSLYSARRNSLIVEQKIKECTSDSQASASSKKPIVLPKIDINKRKHLFENPNNNNNTNNEQNNNNNNNGNNYNNNGNNNNNNNGANVLNQQQLQNQQEVLQLLENVHQPNQKQNQANIGNNFASNFNPNQFQNPEAAQQYFEAFQQGQLQQRGSAFSPLNNNQLNEAVQLFDLFYFANDFDTFYQAACFARDHVNEGQFVYAFYTAVVQRPDTEYIALPAISEVYPQLFVKASTIKQAQDAAAQGQNNFNANVQQAGQQNECQNENSIVAECNDNENAVSYFREDVGLNQNNFYYHIHFPFWFSSQKYNKNNNNNNEKDLVLEKKRKKKKKEKKK